MEGTIKYNRIIIIGSPGSGKSYLAKRIAEATNYPLIHLDNEFWKPGWVKTPREEWIEKQRKILATEKWIIDGNYDSTLDLRFEASDVVIFLDINRYVCMYSAIKRNGNKRSDLPEYCIEKFNKDFVGFLKLIWTFPKTNRLKIMELHKNHMEKPFIIIKSRREVKKLIEGFIH
jgi:adenylate kinase family enzyme